MSYVCVCVLRQVFGAIKVTPTTETIGALGAKLFRAGKLSFSPACWQAVIFSRATFGLSSITCSVWYVGNEKGTNVRMNMCTLFLHLFTSLCLCLPRLFTPLCLPVCLHRYASPPARRCAPSTAHDNACAHAAALLSCALRTPISSERGGNSG